MVVTGCPRLPASLKASAERSAGAFSLWTSELGIVAVSVDSTYSSLSYLRTLQVDVIKLDRSCGSAAGSVRASCSPARSPRPCQDAIRAARSGLDRRPPSTIVVTGGSLSHNADRYRHPSHGCNISGNVEL